MMADSKLVVRVTFEDRFVAGKMDRVWRATAEGFTQYQGSGESPTHAVGDLICRFADSLQVEVMFPDPGWVISPKPK